jgi:hypothetical protein
MVAVASTCACTAPLAPPPQSPATSGGSETASAYPGRCSFVELQGMEQPSPGRGITPDNLGMDTIELVATYRPSGGPDRRPVSYAFSVEKEQVDNLRAHLEQQPDILCEGESAGKDVVPPESATAPSFQGQPGRRLSAQSP